MVCSKSLHRDLQFHRCISVGAVELVMIQFDDISLLLSDQLRHLRKLSGAIRKKNRMVKILSLWMSPICTTDAL